MSEESKIEAVTAQAPSRRKFVKVAVTAPAAALLLNASVTSAKVPEPYRGHNDDVITIPADDAYASGDNPPPINDDNTPTIIPGDDFAPGD